ncbi:sulfite exporter TauE/SafE family protein [Nesterenkonia sp. E16_7]|uniref:sulfite exporter TauE/SafE family protein n=1 Tax=unclassified Nesterenkonia TaxID=2629769 RepID=UPI001A913327|nr:MULTISPECIES: sulfite exporter TauE/SafE family protein [unclassified Nesterenkonia]MBO0594550.1 sulfite exporter TauE/SafE family protein [Nesterenkonia sp. E16_10]MBO0599743.1 sulfite exporter TauE/SafE family protein [Nesterenkonia sp. E16_7]
MMEALADFFLTDLSLAQLLLILVAGIWAGAINTVVGSGTLVTFPVLVAMGVPPVSATVSNAMGLIAGNFTGAWGYRREIRQVKSVLKKLVPASILGGVIGAALLITLPEEVFGRVAPILIVVSLGFVIAQPRLSAWVRARAAAREKDAETAGDPAEGAPEKAATAGKPSMPTVSLVLMLLVFAAGIYGGYFVAAQGILLMGILGIFLMANIQQANGVKNLLVAVVNLTAAISYVLVDYLLREPADRVILWEVVVVIAVGSTLGGLIGAWVGRRLSPLVLRLIIVTLGLVALFVMLRNLFVG